MTIEYVASEFSVDEILVFEDLWVTAHLYAKENEDGALTWLNVRLLEHMDQGEDGFGYQADGVGALQAGYRLTDPRSLDCELIGDGFIKWDGCAEWSIDHHCCGVRNFLNLMTAILRVYKWADEHGFEEVDPEAEIASRVEGSQ